MHSAKMIVVDDTCNIMREDFSWLKGKRVHFYNNDRENLMTVLEEVYGRDFRAEKLLSGLI